MMPVIAQTAEVCLQLAGSIRGSIFFKSVWVVNDHYVVLCSLF